MRHYIIHDTEHLMVKRNSFVYDCLFSFACIFFIFHFLSFFVPSEALTLQYQREIEVITFQSANASQAPSKVAISFYSNRKCVLVGREKLKEKRDIKRTKNRKIVKYSVKCHLELQLTSSTKYLGRHSFLFFFLLTYYVKSRDVLEYLIYSMHHIITKCLYSSPFSFVPGSEEWGVKGCEMQRILEFLVCTNCCPFLCKPPHV